MPRPRNRLQDAGRWADRLRVDRDNPRERAFAEQWAIENKRINSETHTLDHLLYGHGHGNESSCDASCNTVTLPTNDLFERDIIVASTVVQWLGSNVGFDFLEQAVSRCGYSLVKKDKKQ